MKITLEVSRIIQGLNRVLVLPFGESDDYGDKAIQKTIHYSILKELKERSRFKSYSLH